MCHGHEEGELRQQNITYLAWTLKRAFCFVAMNQLGKLLGECQKKQNTNT